MRIIVLLCSRKTTALFLARGYKATGHSKPLAFKTNGSLLFLIMCVPLSLNAMGDKIAHLLHWDWGGKEKIIKTLSGLEFSELSALQELANAVYRERDIDDTNVVNYLCAQGLVDKQGKINPAVCAAVKSNYVFREGQLYKGNKRIEGINNK